MSELSEQHRETAANFSRLAHEVTDWQAPTPVKEWLARDIIDHLCGWLPGMLTSKGIEMEPVVVGEDPAASFDQLTGQVQTVLDDESIAGRMIDNEMAGRQTRVDVLIGAFYIPDVFMHTIDLAWSQGLESGLHPEDVANLAEGMITQKDMLAGSGQFGTPVALDSTHEPEKRLMAIIGRDPEWTRP